MTIDKAVKIDPYYLDFAEQECCKLTDPDSNLELHLVEIKNKCYVSMILDIDADPSEKDARYYITGAYEDVVGSASKQFILDYNRYMQEHPRGAS